MITGAEMQAIRERLETAPKRSRLITQDVPALLDSLAECKRLLRVYAAHDVGCNHCSCGLQELMEAVK